MTDRRTVPLVATLPIVVLLAFRARTAADLSRTEELSPVDRRRRPLLLVLLTVIGAGLYYLDEYRRRR